MNLSRLISSLPPKNKPPNSARTLNAWVSQAERRLEADGGRLGWLVASTIVAAVLQKVVNKQGSPLFLMKGGTLLQHQLPRLLRATSDLDGLVSDNLDAFLEKVDQVIAEDWGPCAFRRSKVEIINVPNRIVQPRRFDIKIVLKGITWRRVRVEISATEGSAADYPLKLVPPSLAGFGLPSPENLLGLAMNYQIAQKIHAVTDPHNPPTHLNDRARDVVDLVLLKELAEITGAPDQTEIRIAIEDVFQARARESEAVGIVARRLPVRVIADNHWETDYLAAAKATGINESLTDSVNIINGWLSRLTD